MMPFCSKCGRVLGAEDVFCPSCGAPADGPSHDGCRADRISTGIPGKSPITAAVLSFLLPGIGHMYANRFSDGVRWLIFLLLLDFFVLMMAPETVDLVTYESYYDFAAVIPLYIAVRLVYSSVSAFSSYRIACRYNRLAEAEGIRPW